MFKDKTCAKNLKIRIKKSGKYCGTPSLILNLAEPDVIC